MNWVWLLHKDGRRWCSSREQQTLHRGTLIVDVELGTSKETTDIVRMPWGAGKFQLRFCAKDRIELICGKGRVTIEVDADVSTETAQLVYSWDIARGWAELALDRSEASQYQRVKAPVQDALQLGRHFPRQCKYASDYICISRAVEPLGAMPGLHGQTPIKTAFGYRPIEQLNTGDLIENAKGDIVPVLYPIQRRVPAFGRFASYWLRAPYLELKGDLLVSAEQRIEMRGSAVEYTFGKEAVLVAAKSLANGSAARPAMDHLFITYHQLLLPKHDAMIAAGVPTESLYIGRLRRHPGQLSRSVLRGVPRNLLPEHAGVRHTPLRDFDAIALLDQRAA